VEGDYVITESQPSGYANGTNTVGNLGGTVSGDAFTVKVKCGDAGTNYDFGEIRQMLIPPPPFRDDSKTPPEYGKFQWSGPLI